MSNQNENPSPLAALLDYCGVEGVENLAGALRLEIENAPQGAWTVADRVAVHLGVDSVSNEINQILDSIDARSFDPSDWIEEEHDQDGSKKRTFRTSEQLAYDLEEDHTDPDNDLTYETKQYKSGAGIRVRKDEAVDLAGIVGCYAEAAGGYYVDEDEEDDAYIESCLSLIDRLEGFANA